jgi:aminodeoxyfutalosine deaminase
VALPVDTAEELRELYRFTDLAHFIDVWFLVTAALRTADDFRRVTVDYAEEAARHGAVYVEAIFAPTVPARNGVPLEAMFEGYCDGVAEARERLGIEIRLTPDLNRTSPPEEAEGIVRHAIGCRDRGVVGVGLGGVEQQAPPEQFADAFRLAREGGLGSVPHAGEVMGPASIWGALDALHADRIRHGIRSLEDPALVRELVDRGTVMDVCPTANVCVGAVRSYDEHPLPEMVSAGLRCSLSTDDPAMFGIDLTTEYDEAASRGLSPREFYEVGIEGALCDEPTRAALRAIGEDFDWASVEATSVMD